MIQNALVYPLYAESSFFARAQNVSGIAYHTLDLLVKEARQAGIPFITLEATSMGRPLYEKYGFVGMRDEMELPKEAWDAG